MLLDKQSVLEALLSLAQLEGQSWNSRATMKAEGGVVDVEVDVDVWRLDQQHLRR